MNKVSKKLFQTNQLHYYSGGSQLSNSGIKVCMLGASSPLAVKVATFLNTSGTVCNMVHRNVLDTEMPMRNGFKFKTSNPFGRSNNFFTDWRNTNMDLHHFRTWGKLGTRFFTYAPDLTSEHEIENAISDCDVVMNFVGNTSVLRRDEDYEEANIEIPRIVAKVCKRLENDPVKRLFHISAAGAYPNAASRRYNTKWIGEQEVLEHFPSATIIRPTQILSNATKAAFWHYFSHCYYHNNSTMMLVDGGKAKCQPVLDNDIALAIMNMIELGEESKGNTYELGGPHEYTYKEVFEFLGNCVNARTTFIDYSFDDIMRMNLSPNLNWEKSAHWIVHRPDYMGEFRTDNVVIKREGIKTFEDLYIKPLAMHHYMADITNHVLARTASQHKEHRSHEEMDHDNEGH